MLWFFNGSVGPPRFIGIHCDNRPEACQMVVLYPDGSEDSESFKDRNALQEAALRLGKGLSTLGWEPCPTATTVTPTES